MKYLLFCCCIPIALFFISGCEDEVDPVLDYNSVKIKKLPPAGEFVYQNNRLEQVGDGQLIYDAEGTLIASRTEAYDTARIYFGGETIMTIHHTITRYSYIWDLGKLTEITLDSLYRISYQDNKIKDFSLLRNYPYYQFFYNGDQIDSIKVSYQTANSRLTAAAFEYDEKLNITQMREYYSPSGPPVINFTEIVTDYEYDNHPNPYQIVYKQTGAILPHIGVKNFSSNNPIKADIRARLGSDWINLKSETNYEYNRHGLPVKIKYNNSETDQIEYF